MHAPVPKPIAPLKNKELLQTWQIDDRYVCKKCCDVARVEEGRKPRWGCIACDFITPQCDSHFRKRVIFDQNVEAAAA